jgi:hypothetical protein
MNDKHRLTEAPTRAPRKGLSEEFLLLVRRDSLNQREEKDNAGGVENGDAETSGDEPFKYEGIRGCQDESKQVNAS